MSRQIDRYITMEGLSAYALDKAKRLELSGKIKAKRVSENILSCLREIKSAHRRVSDYAAENKKIPQEMEWLLDNWYIAEREGKESARSLTHAGDLRKTSSAEPLIWAAAEGLLLSGHNEVTEERIKVFFQSFQREIVFNEREISVTFPIIKAVLISALKDICANGLKGEASEETALMIGNIFTSLRMLSNIDISDILEQISHTEEILSNDPAGIYSEMEEITRQNYRREVARLAKENNLQDFEAAGQILDLAKKSQGNRRHVGYYIFEAPLGKERKKRSGALYICAIVLFSLITSLGTAIALGRPLIAIMLVFPVSEIAKNVIDYFAVKIYKPVHVPRMKLEEGVPLEGRTLCVISALLTDKDSGAEYAKNLEEYALANRNCGKNLIFGVLADFPESVEQDLPESEQWLDMARAEIEGLNKKYGGGFVVLCRDRHFNESDGRYMGWERKRGALLELTRLLTGGKSSLRCEAGNLLMLEGVKYVITLDSDTRLNVGSAKELISAMLHPLNKPEYSDGVVVGGTGLIQPRISVDLESADRTDFTRIFAGQGGIDPYGSASSDVYQDLFNSGSFTGKGIFNVDTYSRCLDGAFPENTILSHDLLEGAYMNASFMGDIELTDGYPRNVLSFYKRMHRWTRGDWQSSPWMFSRVKNAAGDKINNPLSSINKWKVFDNLRRSLVPVFTLLSVLASMLVGGISLLWAGVIAVLSPLSSLLINSAELVFRSSPSTKTRYQSTIISGFAGGFMETLSLLILLPYHAYICLSGAIIALYRMLISKKNMLSWVSASEADKKTDTSVASYTKKMLPATLIGIIIIVFSRYPEAIAVGIVWALSPLFAFSISRDRSRTRAISEDDKLYLTRVAGDIWRYFEDFLTPEDHFLPPDNWQEQPAVGIAHRTSPTNIGLAMLAAVSAIDLNLCPRNRALGYIENIIATVERMEKWNGHLYNWYDTKTLKPLQPAYVSTVDSGNLAGYLIVLRETLYELDEKGLAARADALLRPMDFTVLFDKKRKLFYIGWDMSTNTPTEGWYDLMASEARQTSFIAIARGDIPARHWRKLNRSLVSQDNYSGMASWTGTMFEYLMPNLIMPCYNNSLIYESLKFCVYVQRRHHKPWGISESAFYAFDPDLNYSYKAHGVQRLALKRGLNKELVISPYSTLLALSVDCREAVSNLRRMESMGACGRYGFYEAMDFTPKRQNGEKFQIVKTYMAHHLGMSLLSVCNTLKDNVMQNRFLRDRAMTAYTELLQEKVPVGQVVLRQPPREVPDKPQRLGGGWARSFSGVDVTAPACTVLSNGAYSVMVTETGITRSTSTGGVMLTRFEPNQTDTAMGMSFYLKTEDEIYSLQAAPDYSRVAEYWSEFNGGKARLFTRQNGIESALTISVPKDDLSETRDVAIKNSGETSIPCELVCYFEPVLERQSDYFAHPTFSKLGLETSFSEGAIVVKRRSNGEKPERYLAFTSSEPMEYDTSREVALGREGIRVAISRPAGLTLGTVLDPCVMVRVRLSLKPHETKRVSFALATGEKEKDAILSAKRVLGADSSSSASFLDSTASKLGMRHQDMDFASDLITDIVFLTGYRRELAASIIQSQTGQPGLWPFGISGDLPIIVVNATGEEDMKIATRCIKSKILLHKCGVVFDLVLVAYDGGDYMQSVRRGIKDIISDLGVEAFIGSRGGIHIVDGNADISAILAAAKRVINSNEPVGRHRNTELSDRTPANVSVPCEGKLSHYYDNEHSFVVEAKGFLPANAWCHMLTNGDFGYMATDSGTGHMWRLNARENKITPWKNDTLTTRGPERLQLLRGNEHISLFADTDGYDTKITYGFGFAEWERQIGKTAIKVTAFVPTDRNARIFIVRGKFEPGDQISYYADLVMGADDKNSSYIITDYEDGVVTARNHSNTEFPGERFSVVASETETSLTCDRREYIMGRQHGTVGAGLNPCISITWPTENGIVIVTGTEEPKVLRELTSYAESSAAMESAKAYWRDITGKITVNTPDDRLNSYINGWAIYQTLACRIMGRTSVYQSGGAYGFRDQLQDSAALISTKPEVARKQILLAALHQFVEGDVQHWWHPTGAKGVGEDKGVRTRCSDDLLWLPYVLSEYIRSTGDMDLLNEQVSYITSPALGENEHERYEMPQRSDVSEDVFHHAIRAVDLVLSRGPGLHGLALIGTGDWNDGMNLVGASGRGESVWLTWFLCHVLEQFSILCDQLNEIEKSKEYRAQAKLYATAANRAWDGEWYLRGYYDNGDTLGSSKDDECKIDSIAQSFSTMTSLSEREKMSKALASAVEKLHDRENKVIKLFTPGFEKGVNNPGYISGYAPGLRENGGQYTHGAIWLAMGCLNAGMTEEGYAILADLLPANHDESIYRAEPYVIAADVYSNEQQTGRGGWSWYTGSSGWYLKVVSENLLGLRVRDGLLYIEPNLPKSWNGYTVRWSTENGDYDIEVRNREKYEILVGGEKWDGTGLPLSGKAWANTLHNLTGFDS